MSKTYPDVSKAFQSTPVGDWKDRFAQWFCEKFGGVADIYCDEETGELVAENYKGKEILRKLFLVPDTIKPFVCQAEEPTKEQVLSGVCMWRQMPGDNCLYTVKVDEDGNCSWFSSDQTK